MDMNAFKGLGVAMITPFDKEYNVDIETLRNLTSFLVDNGADYLVTMGTTAETPSLKREEQDSILACIVSENDGKKPIVMGVGGNNTYSAIDEIKNRDLSGVDAILSVVPYYNKPNQAGIYRHFAEIAKSTDLPIILYNIPGRTGVNMTAETTLRLAHDFDNIIAIKEASGDLAQMANIINGRPDDFLVISGDDALTLPLNAIGGDGVISVLGNAYPADLSKMIKLADEGKKLEAREIFYKYFDLFELLFVDGNPVGIKSLMELLGVTTGRVRLPLVRAQKSTVDALRMVLNQQGLL